MNIIDLRSDTVTQPTPEMREAMASAVLGDDVYREDPTVNQLQEIAADMLGHEAGLFVPSGTMGNLSAILAHCARGDEVIMGQRAHIFLYEAGGISALGGVHSCQLKEQANGALALEDIEQAIRWDDPHEPVTRLIEIENSHNRCGGTFQSPEYIQQLTDFAHQRGIMVHLDGARVFNAAAAQGVDVSALTKPVDSVTFCLSKGLCAPVGSVLVGSQAFIKKAHRIRKQLGGGMRQAGVLAAAGIIALQKMTLRLGEDHIRAKKLADGLRQLPGLVLDEGTPATNMIFMDLSDHVPWHARQVAEKMKEQGIRVGVTGERRFRLVLHYWIDDQGVERVLQAFQKSLSG